MATKILVTGAFGNLGHETVEKLLAAGHQVVGLDRETEQTRKTAAHYQGRVEPVWGDICNEQDLQRALQGVSAVLHLAGIIPPVSEQNPALAQRVNVEGTASLIKAIQQSGSTRRLVFTSTFGVFGRVQDREPPLHSDAPRTPDDHYGRSKTAAEEAIEASGLDWTILRICAAPPVHIPKGGTHDISTMFEMSADARIEFIHPEDVSTALCNAVSCDSAVGKKLFLGGGKACQLRGLEFASNMVAGNGIKGSLPAAAFKPCPVPEFYGDWVDTEESQRLLNFQNHSMEDFIRDARKAMGWRYYLVRLISPLAKKSILKHSAYLRATPP